LTVLFPKWTNKLPPILGLGAAAAGLIAIFTVWFWFSPKHTDVGYAPIQPVAYSHKLHAGQLNIDCRYCHRMVEEGPHATVPDTATCWGCHAQVHAETKPKEGEGGTPRFPKLALVRDSFASGAAIPWVKVHMLPDYAYFSHALHEKAGVGCVSCHGRIDEMEVVRQVQPLSMSWCLECHRDPAPNIRPAGVAPTLMTWQPTDDSIRQAQDRLAKAELNPPTHCSACHR
jgi:hypothetical protein